MGHTRKLSLAAERLTELTRDDLGAVAGGQEKQPTYTCPDYTYYCITGYAMCRSTRVICA